MLPVSRRASIGLPPDWEFFTTTAGSIRDTNIFFGCLGGLFLSFCPSLSLRYGDDRAAYGSQATADRYASSCWFFFLRVGAPDSPEDYSKHPQMVTPAAAGSFLNVSSSMQIHHRTARSNDVSDYCAGLPEPQTAYKCAAFGRCLATPAMFRGGRVGLAAPASEPAVEGIPTATKLRPVQTARGLRPNVSADSTMSPVVCRMELC